MANKTDIKNESILLKAEGFTNTLTLRQDEKSGYTSVQFLISEEDEIPLSKENTEGRPNLIKSSVKLSEHLNFTESLEKLVESNKNFALVYKHLLKPIDNRSDIKTPWGEKWAMLIFIHLVFVAINLIQFIYVWPRFIDAYSPLLNDIWLNMILGGKLNNFLFIILNYLPSKFVDPGRCLKFQIDPKIEKNIQPMFKFYINDEKYTTNWCYVSFLN
jgi:hypothetical protein